MFAPVHPFPSQNQNRQTNRKRYEYSDAEKSQYKNYDSEDPFSTLMPSITVDTFTLKFDDEQLEKAYQLQRQRVLYTFEGFKVCFIFCWVWALCEVLYNYFVKNRVRALYIWVTILCFFSAHIVPYFVQNSKHRVSLKELSLNLLYLLFILGCMLILFLGVEAFNNDLAFGLVVGGFIGNCTLMGHIFSIDFRFFAFCISLLCLTSMIIFAKVSKTGEWLPEESRICFAYSYFLILCSRIVILQDRKNYGLFELQKNEVIRQKLSFISQVAHDIGTPLASLSLALQCLNLTKDRKEKCKLILNMKTSVEMLVMIRNEVINISKVKVGLSLDPNETVISPNDLLERCSRVISSFPGGEGDIEFEFYLDPRMPLETESDFQWVWNMMINLLSNAKKYSKQGRVRVSLYEWRSMVWFEVEDKGDGIPDEQKELLFKAFSQLEDRRNGTGLGLYGVATKATILGGGYGLRNNPFQSGSVFWFNFPLKGPGISRNRIREKQPSELVLLGNWDLHLISKFQNTFDEYFQDFVILQSSELSSLGNTELPSNRVLCWREKFSLHHIHSVLGNVNETYNISSIFLVHDGSAQLSVDVRAALKRVTKRCSQFATVYELKPSLEDDDIIRTLRSRVWASNSKLLFEDSMASSFSSSLYSTVSDTITVDRSCSQHESKRILLIEDTEAISSLIKKLLEGHNIRVQSVSNGRDGLNMLKDPQFEKVACCLVDLNLPIMDGVECIRKFRKWEREQKELGNRNEKTLLFAFTSHISKKMTDKALKAGADAILPKQFEVEDIESLIQKCAKNRNTWGYEEPSKNCIIVIDDTPSVSKLVQRLLTKEGFDVKTAKNGKEGLSLLQCESPNYFKCALCDLSMPVMDGIECIERYREWEKKGIESEYLLRRSTIFAFTAHGDEKKKELALQVGAQAILPKPFNMLQLKELMAQYCFIPGGNYC